MDLVTAKVASDVKLSGVKVEFERNDNQVVSIKITDDAGEFAVIKAQSSYSHNLSVLTKAPPRMEDKFALRGEFAGVKVFKIFDSKYEAESAMSQFGCGADLRIDPISVEVDEVGGVKQPDLDLPF